jgi:hypothetical protein
MWRRFRFRYGLAMATPIHQQANAPRPTVTHPAPRLGDPVEFYRDRSAEPEAAIICDVGDEEVCNLAVFDKNGSSRGEVDVPVDAAPDGRSPIDGRHYRWRVEVPAGAVASKGRITGTPEMNGTPPNVNAGTNTGAPANGRAVKPTAPTTPSPKQ